MHPDLSPHLHTDECNKLIEQYRACHRENKFLKFVGVCNDLDRAVWKCLKAEVNFDVGKFNRLENQVSGKGKRGAQMIGPRSPVCKVICADGTSYTILAGVNGKLIEVNERLDTNPQLLSESPKEDGYLAIVLPPLRNGNVLLNRLLSKEKYEALMNENLRESVE
ncbi:protein Abitram-like isoform X2 [Macrobrachium rosenbergii]|uniref:protein Abitram-like isoform X2 n=1 Tax=Macrobrachium rosenbergii TaxID=79674 RepID=UPI0034D72A07